VRVLLRQGHAGIHANKHKPKQFLLKIVPYFLKIYTEAVFLVMLGTSSFPAGHEVYGKTTEKFVPSWERARTQHG